MLVWHLGDNRQWNQLLLIFMMSCNIPIQLGVKKPPGNAAALYQAAVRRTLTTHGGLNQPALPQGQC